MRRPRVYAVRETGHALLGHLVIEEIICRPEVPYRRLAPTRAPNAARLGETVGTTDAAPSGKTRPWPARPDAPAREPVEAISRWHGGEVRATYRSRFLRDPVRSRGRHADRLAPLPASLARSTPPGRRFRQEPSRSGPAAVVDNPDLEDRPLGCKPREREAACDGTHGYSHKQAIGWQSNGQQHEDYDTYGRRDGEACPRAHVALRGCDCRAEL